jgi:hypothetical protein
MIAAAALVSAALVQSPPAPVDFSGFWVPDPGKSTYTKELKAPDPEAPDAPPPPPGNLPPPPALRIASRAAELVVEYLDQGAAIATLALATDGHEVTNPRGMLTQTSSSHFENGAFVTTWQLNRRDVLIMNGVDTWRLSPDGATLTIDSRMEDSKSRSTTKTTYTKQ